MLPVCLLSHSEYSFQLSSIIFYYFSSVSSLIGPRKMPYNFISYQEYLIGLYLLPDCSVPEVGLLEQPACPWRWGSLRRSVCRKTSEACPTGCTSRPSANCRNRKILQIHLHWHVDVYVAMLEINLPIHHGIYCIKYLLSHFTINFNRCKLSILSFFLFYTQNNTKVMEVWLTYLTHPSKFKVKRKISSQRKEANFPKNK